MLKRQFDPEKAVESLLYVARHASIPDIYHILKIIYFADKDHLEKYGRFIYNDTYVALRHGPVPSTTYDIIKYVRGDGYFAYDHALKSFEVQPNDNIMPFRDAILDIMSDSEIECLDNAIKKYGSLSFKKLKELSHDEAYKAADLNDIMDIETIAGTLKDGHLLVEHLHSF